jgi:hypothetical protein
MFSYFAYGLGIQSEIYFPELVAGQAACDVIVRYGEIDLSQADIGNAVRKLINTPEGVILYWQEIGAFLVKKGCEIIVDPVDGTLEEKIRPFILGGTLGVLLRQRDLMVFHSSVIDFNIGAVAFMACKGHGKSTMAAALYQRGNNLVTDDIMACDDSGGELMVLSGYPQFKLWPDSIEAIGRDPEAFPRLYPTIEKRVFRFSNRFTTHSLLLRAVFVIAPGPELKIEQLSSKAALLKIMPHWYGAMFDGEMMKVFGIKNHIQECKKVIDQVPVFQISGPPDIDRLVYVAGQVEDYICKNLR